MTTELTKHEWNDAFDYADAFFPNRVPERVMHALVDECVPALEALGEPVWGYTVDANPRFPMARHLSITTTDAGLEKFQTLFTMACVTRYKKVGGKR